MTKRKQRPTAESILKNVGAARRANLRALIGEDKPYSTQVELASALGCTDGYLSQIIGPRPSRPVTETTARKIEYKLRLKTGSLDVVG